MLVLNCVFKDSLLKFVSVGIRVVGEFVCCEFYLYVYCKNIFCFLKILCIRYIMIKLNFLVFYKDEEFMVFFYVGIVVEILN